MWTMEMLDAFAVVYEEFLPEIQPTMDDPFEVRFRLKAEDLQRQRKTEFIVYLSIIDDLTYKNKSAEFNNSFKQLKLWFSEQAYYSRYVLPPTVFIEYCQNPMALYSNVCKTRLQKDLTIIKLAYNKILKWNNKIFDSKTMFYNTPDITLSPEILAKIRSFPIYKRQRQPEPEPM